MPCSSWKRPSRFRRAYMEEGDAGSSTPRSVHGLTSLNVGSNGRLLGLTRGVRMHRRLVMPVCPPPALLAHLR